MVGYLGKPKVAGSPHIVEVLRETVGDVPGKLKMLLLLTRRTNCLGCLGCELSHTKIKSLDYWGRV